MAFVFSRAECSVLISAGHRFPPPPHMSSTTRERTRARARALSALGRNLHRVRDHRLPRQRRGRLRRALPRPVRPGRRRVSAGRAGGQIDCAAPTAVASGLRTVHAAGLARSRTARQPRLGPTPARLWGLSLAHTHHRGPGCTSAAPRLHLCRTSAAPRLNLGCISAAPRPHLGRTSALPLSVALVEASRQPLHDSSTRGQVVVDVVGTTIACVVAHHVYSLFSSAEESAPS